MTSRSTPNPSPKTQACPEWVSELPPPLRTLLEEIYVGLELGQHSLTVMGIRALIDGFIHATVGDVGTFEAKLVALERQGFIGTRDKRWLRIIIQAGSAASHRGATFDPQRIRHMLDCVEPLLRTHWVLGPSLQEIEAEIPPRPARPPRP